MAVKLHNWIWRAPHLYGNISGHDRIPDNMYVETPKINTDWNEPREGYEVMTFAGTIILLGNKLGR